MALDPPVYSIPAGNELIGSVDSGGFTTLPQWDDPTKPTTVRHVTLPRDGSAWSDESRDVAAGFQIRAEAGGTLFGIVGGGVIEIPVEFRAIDKTTHETVASHPLGFRISILKELRGPGWYLMHYRPSSGGNSRLIRFDGISRSIHEQVVPAEAGTYPGGRLVGVGDGWLAFVIENLLLDKQRLLVLDSETYEPLSDVTLDHLPRLKNYEASHGRTQYLVAGDQALAIDVFDGTLSVVGEGNESAPRSHLGLAASDQGLWILGARTANDFKSLELQLWQRDPGGQGWSLHFRGRPDRWDQTQVVPGYGSCVASAEGALLKTYGFIDVFRPASSRPILLAPRAERVPDGGGRRTILLELDRPPSQPVSVHVRNSGGTATPGVDYVPIDREVIFPAGEPRVELEVEILEDRVAESHETVRLEFSRPLGLSLPDVRYGSFVIEASGPEYREVKLFSPSGKPFVPWEVLVHEPDVTIAVEPFPENAGPARICLWDTATGAFRAETGMLRGDSWNDIPKALRTETGLDFLKRDGINFQLLRSNPETGAPLGSLEFSTAGPFQWSTLLGNGRVLVVYWTGGNSYFTKVYEIGGSPAGTSFPIPEGIKPSDRYSFLSDGRHLVASWNSENGVGLPGLRHFGVFDVESLELLWRWDVSQFGSFEPLSVVGGKVLCATLTGMVAIDLERREIAWKAPGAGSVASAGAGLWFQGNIIDPAAFDLATGERLGGPPQLGETFGADTQIATGGGAGVLFRNSGRLLKACPDRTRPAVRLMTSAFKQSHEGDRILLRAAEPTDLDISITAEASAASASELEVDPGPFLLPPDGRILSIPYHFQPRSGSGHAHFEERFGVRLSISTNGEDFAVTTSLPLVTGIPIAPPHLGAVIPPSADTGLAGIHGIRACDGKLVAWSGGIRATGRQQRVDVMDPETGELIQRILDTSGQTRSFGRNAILQDNLLLVTSRVYSAEAGTAEVFDITSGDRVALQEYRGKLPGFGDSLASNGTYFAIATPGMELGKPAGSMIEVFRWSDFSRVLRKTAGRNSRLGYGLAFDGDILRASAPGKTWDWTKGKVVGYRLPKGKVPVLKANSGYLVKGSKMGSNRWFVVNEELHAYEGEGKAPVWKRPLVGSLLRYVQPASAGEGWVVIRDLRDVTLIDEKDGEILASTRFHDTDNLYNGKLDDAAVIGDSVFTVKDGLILKTPLRALGDFRAWRRLQGLTVDEAGPDKDIDGNGNPDFDDYLDLHWDPAVPFATAELEDGKVRAAASRRPPPDVLVLVEAEVAPDAWRVVAWREGHGSWHDRDSRGDSASLLADLPDGSVSEPALRLRFLPVPSYRDSVSLSWPFIATERFLFGVPPLDSAGDDDGDGMGNALEIRMGTNASLPGSGPLEVRSDGGPTRLSFVQLRYGGDEAVVVESSNDCHFWAPVEDDPELEIAIEPLDDQYDLVTVTPLTGVPRKFFRLQP